jgi:hypothetical protein
VTDSRDRDVRVDVDQIAAYRRYMSADDGPPIDLEPIDLEPVDLEPALDRTPFDRGRKPGDRSRWIWVAVACGLAAWAVVALTTRHGHTSRKTTPTPPAGGARIDHVHVAGVAMRAGLARLGVERFASVIDDRLYTFDSTSGAPTLVPLPEGHVTVTDQNGSSLLAWTFQQTLVSTRPIAIRPFPARTTAVRAVTPGRWWLLSNGTIRRDQGDTVEQVPAGLHVIGAVDRGFIAYDDHGRWLLWNTAKTPSGAITEISFPLPLDQFLVASPRSVVFMGGCGSSGCNIYIYEVDTPRLEQIHLTGVPAFGTFSPDGTRLAISTNQGDVFMLDSANGETIARTTGVAPPSPTLPLSWTADARALLVVQDGRIEIRRATDGAIVGAIDNTEGVQQLIALP